MNEPFSTAANNSESLWLGVTKQVLLAAPPNAPPALPFARVVATLRLSHPLPPSQSESSDDFDTPAPTSPHILMSGASPMEVWLDAPFAAEGALSPAVNLCLLSMRRGERAEFTIPTSRLQYSPARREGVGGGAFLLTVELKEVQPEIEVVAPRLITKHIVKAAAPLDDGTMPLIPVAYATIDVRLIEYHRVTRNTMPLQRLRSVIVGAGSLPLDVSVALRTMHVGELAKVYCARSSQTFLVHLERCVNPPPAIDGECIMQAMRMRELATSLVNQRLPHLDAHAYVIYTDAFSLLQDDARFTPSWLAVPCNAEERRTTTAVVSGNLGLLARDVVSPEESYRLLCLSAELLPSHRSLFRVGRAAKLLGKMAEAATHFGDAAARIDEKTPSEEAAEIRRELAACEEASGAKGG